MKTKLLLTFTIFFIGYAAFAQQIENGGFEDWELITAINLEEPVDWSSIKTTDAGSTVNNAAPKVWDKSTDAHSGSYSVQVINKSTFGVIATGTLTNGRVHASLTNPLAGYTYTDTNDARWHTIINARPDSIVGWFKADVNGTDVPTVKAILHNGYAQIPPPTVPDPSWIGYVWHSMPNADVTEWTRFSIPITYQSMDVPKYFFILLNADDGVDPVDGSVVWFDDLELIYNAASIGENETESYNIFISENTLYLRNIPPHVMKNAEVEILDITGKMVWQDKVNSDAMLFDASIIREGIYIVRFITTDNVVSRKVLLR